MNKSAKVMLSPEYKFVFFENKLKVKATTRNWRTVNELVKNAEKY
jgi:hypothetical protein